MCSICGIYDPRGVGEEEGKLVGEMGATMSHRGPDDRGSFLCGKVALQHNRLAVVDPVGGKQPMTITHGGKTYTVVYNGELYNTDRVRGDLMLAGVTLHTSSDTEVVVCSYALWGERCVEHLNGIFAFAIYDNQTQSLFCARDRLGVKPFFYVREGEKFLFASEIKALLKHPAVKPKIDRVGLWQLLYLSPVTLPGKSVFSQIEELLPGECCTLTKEGFQKYKYFTLRATPHTMTRDETVAYTRFLLEDAIGRQLVSDVPLCCFLSGGLDSSIVSAVAAAEYRRRGMGLDTYSFEYEGNEYAPTLFQPNPDDRYATLMAEYIGASHTVLRATSEGVAEALLPSVVSRDFPGQADIDSSLLYFCSQVKKRHTVALSGECADEIFGGYPWFYRPEMLGRDFFPWIHDPHARIRLFREEAVEAEEGYAYLSQVYRQTVAETPLLDGEEPEDRQARVACKLSVDYFMASLLERKDRMSMAHGLEVRVPFSDHRILEFIYNVPWKIKYEGGVEKALLRNAMAPYLPGEILWRKKSPYPKTHNPAYEAAVHAMLRKRLNSPGSRLREVLAGGALQALEAGGDVTWQGQLMGRPQMLAWLLQFDFFLDRYGVEFTR